MKRLFLVFTTLLLISLTACEKPRGSESADSPESTERGLRAIDELFERTLIVGASVSADHRGVASPVRLLAREFGYEANVIARAQSGRPASVVVPAVSDTDYDSATLIVGFDLFFWDSVQRDCSSVRPTLERLLSNAKARTLPVVVANVPALRFNQPCRDTINQALADACRADEACHVYDLAAVESRIDRDGGATFEGRFYTRKEIQPDGLHLSPIGSRMLAAELAAWLREQPL